MTKRIMTLGRLVVACALALGLLLGIAVEPSADEMRPGRPAGAPVVEYTGIIDTRIHDVDGNLHRLGSESGYRPVALVFLDPGCPISRRYAPELAAMVTQARTDGVELYGVVSDPTLTAAEARTFGREYADGLPLLWDVAGDLAHRLTPEMVPEAIVVDADDRVVYRGRIDNRFVSPGRLRGTITETELLDAIAATASGRTPAVAHAQPVGCFFEAWSNHDLSEVNYERQVAPLLAANCVECHTAGGIGPFPLDTYDNARRRAGMMAWTATERIMPPWQAEDGFGHFRGARVLSDRQIDVLSAWAGSEKPRGVEADRLEYAAATSSDWRAGAPDLVIEMPESFDVPATGDDIYRYFVVPAALAEGALIRGIDFRPGDPAVVHHAILYVDYGGTARRLDAADPGLGFAAFGGDAFMGVDDALPIGGWAPGADPYLLPEGLAQDVPAGADFVFEIHYHLTGRATRDRSSVALYLAEEDNVDRFVQGLYLATENIEIEAGDADYTRHLSINVPADIDLVDISPHMHYLGRSARVVATLPDGEQVPLISLPDWDFRWQSVYVYQRPVRLPAGSRIDAWYRFDNSADNPANPSSPPRAVRYGLQSFDEMCELYLTYAPVDPADVPALERAMVAALMSADGVPRDDAALQEPADPLQLLHEVGMWDARAESLLFELDEPAFVELLERVEEEASGSGATADSHALLGGMYLTALFFEQDSRRQVQVFMSAEDSLGKALRMEPSHWDAQLTRGVLYLVSEERSFMREAVRGLEALLEQQDSMTSHPRFARTYEYLGEAYAALGRDDDAARVWQQGADAFPDDAELRARAPEANAR